MNALAHFLDVLRSPENAKELSLESWGEVLKIGRITALLPRLAVALHEREVEPLLPSVVQSHLQAARILVEANERAVLWEVRRLQLALRGAPFRAVLLKGAAYIAAGLPFRGRLCSDVDLLVPLEHLAQCESQLRKRGWEVANISPRHERYFRRWLHELPPLQHAEHELQVDVHHSLLPRTDSLKLNTDELLQSTRDIGSGCFHILAAEDMTLHCLIHLFRNGDFRRGLRDLHDLDRMLCFFAREPEFGRRLQHRIVQFQLTAPCYFAFRAVERIFATPLPDSINAELDRWRPAWPQSMMMESLLERALEPKHVDYPDMFQEWAIRLLAYWPLPKCSVITSPLFWTKRFQRMYVDR